MAMENSSDQRLIKKYLKGDKASLEILIKKYLKPIYFFVYKYVGNVEEAEDITQDVFVKTWRNLKKFDRQKNFKTWIFSIAKNTSIDFIRRKKTVPFSELLIQRKDGTEENDFLEKIIDPSLTPNDSLERKSIAETFKQAIDKLFPKYRAVLLLRYNNNFTFREIAESLGEPLNTVKSRYRRALILLRKLLFEA